MNLTSIFTGVPQSRYAALAVVVAIGVVCIAILFGKDTMPLTQKLSAIVLLILVSAPGILFSLFQLTCLVTGAGFRNQRWWCGAYAWIITALLVVYSVLLVGISILSISTNSKVIADLTSTEHFTDSMNAANAIAGSMTSSDKPAVSSTNSSTTVSGQVGNGNVTSSMTNNKAYSYSSSVLPVDLTDSKESFRGSVGDANNSNSGIVGGHDEAAPYPYNDGTLVPKQKQKEGFQGTIGDPNNIKSRVVGGNDEPAAYPFN